MLCGLYSRQDGDWKAEARERGRASFQSVLSSVSLDIPPILLQRIIPHPSGLHPVEGGCNLCCGGLGLLTQSTLTSPQTINSSATTSVKVHALNLKAGNF